MYFTAKEKKQLLDSIDVNKFKETFNALCVKHMIYAPLRTIDLRDLARRRGVRDYHCKNRRQLTVDLEYQDATKFPRSQTDSLPIGKHGFVGQDA